MGDLQRQARQLESKAARMRLDLELLEARFHSTKQARTDWLRASDERLPLNERPLRWHREFLVSIGIPESTADWLCREA